MQSAEIERKGRAAVTGASSGIGWAFAERLAADGFDLLIIARRRERLEELAEKVRSRHGVEVDVVVADLCDSSQRGPLEKRLAEDPDLSLLVNNAGFATAGDFTQLDVDREDDCLQLLIVAVVRLTHAALQGMLERGRGAIINVSSRLAFQPSTELMTYSAAKSFVNSFTLGLAASLHERGVRCVAVCPGTTRTEIFDLAGIDISGFPEDGWLEPDGVVSEALDYLERGEVVCVPGERPRDRWIRKVTPRRLLWKGASVLRRLGGF